MPTLTLLQAEGLVVRTLTRNRTNVDNARSVARALIGAEADGLKGHGLSRVPMYAAQAKVRKVDGMALPQGILEKREKLEQLRALEAGMRIDVALVDTVPLGVDTPAELERARAILGAKDRHPG